MHLNIQNIKDYAVTEVVGAVLIIMIAVVVSAFIYTQVLPFEVPSDDVNVHVMGQVHDDGYLVLEHMGGTTLDYYEILITKNDETQLFKYQDDPWEIGEQIRVSLESLPGFETYDVHVTVFSISLDDSRQMIFDATLSPTRGSYDDSGTLNESILISTFRTNSVDEDLLCFTEYIISSFPPKSYIYNWIVNDKPLAEVLLPFDIDNEEVAKDYSGYDNNASVSEEGISWVSNGKVGGAYYFDGGAGYLSMPLPNILNNIQDNDLTISLWVKSDDITQDHRLILQGGKQSKDFIILFQMGCEIHFGVSEGGTKHAVRTDTLESNTWYHIVCVWDADEKTLVIYTNGVPSYEVGYRTYAMGLQEGLDLGHGTASSRFWLGYVDEFRVYDRELTPNQIYHQYLRTSMGIIDFDILVAQETRVGERWKCIITPNNGFEDDVAIISNTLTITNYLGGD
jgi:hypothetical protein